MDVGKHPLVARLLKGGFHARPPLPRYTGTWNVQVVLDCMLQWGDTTSLSLKLLTYKLVMLMSLASPSRSADLASLCIDHSHYKPEGVVFVPSVLAKQSRQGKPLTEYFFASFTDNKEFLSCWDLKTVSKGNSFLEKGIDISVCGYCQTSQTGTTLHSCSLVEIKLSGPIFLLLTPQVVHPHQLQQTLRLLPVISWKQQTGALSLCLENFITGLLTTHRMAELCYIKALVRPNLLKLVFLAGLFNFTHAMFELQTTPLICETEPSEI